MEPPLIARRGAYAHAAVPAGQQEKPRRPGRRPAWCRCWKTLILETAARRTAGNPRRVSPYVDAHRLIVGRRARAVLPEWTARPRSRRLEPSCFRLALAIGAGQRHLLLADARASAVRPCPPD